jgi:hypothetical protein
MARVIRIVQVEIVRGRGRPRVDSRRVECMVPPEVYEQLIREEQASGTYRTRVAANVLCEWASGRSAPSVQASC